MSASDVRVQWITLGTLGCPFQSPAAHQISNALVVGETIYVFDVGNGVLRQLAKAGLDPTAVRAVFTTHHHIDHIADLALTIFTRWLRKASTPLRVFGPEGTERFCAHLMPAYALAEWAQGGPSATGLDSAVWATDVPRGGGGLHEVYRDELVVVESTDVEHFHTPWAADRSGNEAEHAVAYRISVGGRVIAYTGDTGPCPALSALVRGAHLLVSEIVNPDAILEQLQRTKTVPEEELQTVGFVMRTCHLEAREVARLALESQVAEVVLTHLVPYPSQAAARALRDEVIQHGAPGRVHVAHDLDVFEVR